MTKELEQYILDHTDQEPENLYQLNREAHRDLLWPRMVSGHLQGRILRMLCMMIKPQRILEIGTFAGYSALCMAEALNDTATIDTLEINDELEPFITKHLKASSHAHKIKLHFGDALKIIPTLEGHYDLVFIDANKRHYPEYYNAIFDKVSPGGYIIGDNILWDGKVVEKVPSNDKQTQGIIRFNAMIKNDSRVDNIILPIRDGMIVARKKD